MIQERIKTSSGTVEDDGKCKTFNLKYKSQVLGHLFNLKLIIYWNNPEKKKFRLEIWQRNVS